MKQISSLQHPLVKHLVKLRQSRRYRDEQQAVLVEGKKLVAELESTKVFAVEASLIPKNAAEAYLVSPAVLKKVSGVDTPEGVVAEVRMPAEHLLEGFRYVVVLDGVSDPGNLGTVLRTALALGWEGAFLTNNCCDPYNDKALRAAKGATFRLPLRQGSWEVLRDLIQTNRWHPVAADLEGTPLEAMSPPERILLVLGSESHGLSPEAKGCCEKVTIPMSGKMESLNVAAAGGILMYQLIRK